MDQKVFKPLIVHENAFSKDLRSKMLLKCKEIQMIRHIKCFLFHSPACFTH